MPVEMRITHNVDAWQTALDALPRTVVHRASKMSIRRGIKEALRRFQRTVATWSNKPQFDEEYEEARNEYTGATGTQDQVWNWLDAGTRKNYPIPKSPLPYPLRFRSMYQAKTMPGMLSSKAGGASGPYVTAWQVTHPGIEARGFTKNTFKEIKPITMRLLIKLISKYLKASARRAARQGEQ